MIGAIQAGGRSRRMGRDKAWLPLGGRPLIEHVLAAARPVVDRVVIVIDPGSDQAERYREFAAQAGVDVQHDLHPGIGPLGGIETALAGCSSGESALVLACDLPYLSTEFLALLRSRHEEGGAAVTVPVDHEGHLQPLVAVYSESCRRVIPELIATRLLRVDLLYQRVPTLRVAAADYKDLRGWEKFFTNLNTLDEYRREARIAGEE